MLTKKMCPNCYHEININRRTCFRAIFIDVTRAGPRIYCPKCHKALDFSYTWLPVISIFLWFLALPALTSSDAIITIGYILGLLFGYTFGNLLIVLFSKCSIS